MTIQMTAAIESLTRALLSQLTGNLEEASAEPAEALRARLAKFLEGRPQSDSPYTGPRVARVLQGAELDYWFGRSLGFNVEIVNDSGTLVCVAADERGQRTPCRPSTDPMQAAHTIAGLAVELKPPAQPGDNWEAWLDARRLPDLPAGTVAVGPGITWMQALCRARVAGYWGEQFNAGNPVPQNQVQTGSPGIEVKFGTATAVQTPAPAAIN